MAQKVLTILVSDITGKEIAEGDGETVAFTLDGQSYELDLTNKEADKFRGLFQDYIAVARKSGGRRTARSASKSSGSKEDLAAIREWAKANGHEVSERGRIAQSVKDAYYAAN